jgi:2-keto-4-pentenoate hydratase/2-oxohepta-3-ene-1,7-dioic acid hydratase in catechol pathway
LTQLPATRKEIGANVELEWCGYRNKVDYGAARAENRRFEQQGNTSDMLFSVYEIVAYLSRHMRMVPGDILATGTPSGVGMGKNRFLDVGDILECGITNLGAQRHPIVA